MYDNNNTDDDDLVAKSFLTTSSSEDRSKTLLNLSYVRYVDIIYPPHATVLFSTMLMVK